MNTFLNMDCEQGILKLFENNIKVDSVIADLPYYCIVGDEWDNQWKSKEDYFDWVQRTLCSIKSILKPNASIMLFTSRQLNRQIACILDKLFKEQRIIIWARKRNLNNTRGKALASGYEPICYYTQGNATFNNLKIKPQTNRKEYISGMLSEGVSLSDVWTDIPALPHNSKEKVNHPTQKPIKLIQRCIEMCTNKDDIILDFCSGSGTTGIAAKALGRNSICIEKELSYHNIAIQRYREMFLEEPDEF